MNHLLLRDRDRITQEIEVVFMNHLSLCPQQMVAGRQLVIDFSFNLIRYVHI